MAKGNGKTDRNIDLDHELPAAESLEEAVPDAAAATPAEVCAASELDKVKA